MQAVAQPKIQEKKPNKMPTLQMHKIIIVIFMLQTETSLNM